MGEARLQPDPAVVRAFAQRLHGHVAGAFAGIHQPGMMQLVAIHPESEATIAFPFSIGQVDYMVDEAVRQASNGHNVYVEARTVRPVSGRGRRGGIADTVAVFGLVNDADADKGKAGRLDIEPSFVIETSPGNAHHWILLDRPLPAEQARALGAAIRTKGGADSATGVITQPYRVPGTPNFPGKLKIARGRVATPTAILSLDGPIWTAEELEAAFPAREKPEASAGPRPSGTSGKTSGHVEELVAEAGPDRSGRFYAAVAAAFADGLTPDDLEALMRRHPNGCGGKYLDPYDRLAREIERAWEKVEEAAEARRRAAEQPIAPTYPDRRVSVAEAEAATQAITAAFFGEHVPAWQAERGAWKAEHAAWLEESKAAKEERRDPPPEPAKPAAVAWAARIETGIGKTAVAIARAADAAKAGIVTVYAAPMHSLLAELAERFAAHGVEARVYRGYTAEDPDAPGLAMCLDLSAMQDARDAGTDVPGSVCKRTVDGQKLHCRFLETCGMEKQRNAKAAVWLVPHALLGHQKPGFIPEPDAIVVDEGIVLGALPDRPARISLDAIRRAPIDLPSIDRAFTNFANDLESARGNLLRALDAHPGDGPLQRAILIRHGVTRAIAGSAYSAEWARKRDSGIVPGMSPTARKALAATVGQHNAEVMLLAGIWNEVGAFLGGEAETSGRLSLRFDLETQATLLERRSLDTIASSWFAPVLALDATLPEAALLEPALGQRAEIRADITARWSPHVRTRQIVGSPTTAGKLGIVEGKQPEEPRRAVHYLARLIRLRAALAWPRIVVVIAPKRLIALFDGLGLPENVETGHFGAIAGIDRWKDAAGLVCIGRLQPGPPVAETMAGIVTGRVPQTVPPNEKGHRWYPKVEAGIRLASGHGVRVEMERHPDPIAEALRAQVTEGQLIQAIGRLRPLRRTAETPAFIDIVSDVPLPVSVDATAIWDDALPGAWANMAPAGILLESPADIMRAFPDLAPTRDAAREHTVATMGVTPIWETLIGVTPGLATVCRYKRQGQDVAACYLLPNRPTDLPAWMAGRLKGLEWVEVEGEKRQGPPTATPAGDGIALDSAADMAAAWPDRWATMAAARDWRSRTGGITLDGASIPVRYQRAGRNQKWRTGAFDPAVVPDPRAWLESRLGPLAGFHVEGTAEPSAPPAADRRPARAPAAAPHWHRAIDCDPDLVVRAWLRRAAPARPVPLPAYSRRPTERHAAL